MSSKSTKKDKFSWMDSQQLGRILRELPAFAGVFAVDTLPNSVTSYPSAYVINSDILGGPGIHWMAIYFEQTGKGHFFDSYGRHPSIYNLTSFLDVNSSTWTYNVKCIQSTLTFVCGAYCVYFLLMKSAGVNEWLEPFGSNLILNDCIVLDFVKRFADVE